MGSVPPSFRAWWRWLAPLHSEPFVRFLQESFHLPALGGWPGEVRPLGRHDGGFAWDRWNSANPAGYNAALKYFGFFATLEGQESDLVAGVVEVEIDRPTARWSRDRFYVPAGLWGVGIGEAFLDALIDTLARDPYGLEEIRVEVEAGDEAWDALYMGAGFHRDSDGSFNRKLSASDQGPGTPRPGRPR